MTTHTVTTRRLRRTLSPGLIGALVASIGFAGSTSADSEGQSPIRTELGVDFFSGTFDESPYLQMLVGGTAEEFCADNPTDPFNAEPSSAPGRIYFRSDGSVDVRIDSRSEEVNIYTSDTPDGRAWITQVCAGDIEPVWVYASAPFSTRPPARPLR